MDIKASEDFTMFPGESKCIDTRMKIVTAEKTSIIAETPVDMLFKTKILVLSNTLFRTGNEDSNITENFKFILHNYESPIVYPVTIPGERPSWMMNNKVVLVNSQQIESTVGLVPVNSYLIKQNDVIARVIITKLGG